MKWHTRNLVIGSTRNWAKSVVNWNLALDPTGGPHVGGCGTCTGVITVGPGDTVTRNAEYYTLGHLARFVEPGAVRLASTSFGTTGWNGQVMDVAFGNPDGSRVLVAHNENDNPQAFGVSVNGRSFTYTLPGGALATFVWPGSRPDGQRALDPTGWHATANPPAPAIRAARATWPATPSTTTRRPATRPAAGQAPGQYLQVDLGRRTAGAAGRARHRHQPRRLPARVRGFREPRRLLVDARHDWGPAAASSPGSTWVVRARPGTCGSR